MGGSPIACRSTAPGWTARRFRLGAFAWVVAASLLASPAAAREEPEALDDVPVVSRIKTIFASLPKFEHPCGDLDLHWQSHVAPALREIGPENLNHARKKRSEFKTQLKQVDKARELANNDSLRQADRRPLPKDKARRLTQDVLETINRDLDELRALASDDPFAYFVFDVLVLSIRSWR